MHTPGPWVADAHFTERRGGRTYIPVMRPGNDPVPVAVVHRDVDGYGLAEGEANARLIAAAPEQHAAGTEIDRLLLVIESAVRNADPAHHAAVLAALKANRAAVAKVAVTPADRGQS